jgi:sulfide:quinone oxidoreductase
MQHRTVIIGGGTAGITAAARLRNAGEEDVAVIEPSATHYYQPLWTLVGGGVVRPSASARSMSSVMPRGVRWLQEPAAAVDPDGQRITLASGNTVGYEYLVVAPGLQLDFDAVPGLSATLGRDGVSSNYRYDLAPRMWEFLHGLRGGRAVFTMPAGAIKCGGAPQKIAYLAADQWRRAGVLEHIRITLALPTPAMFGLPAFARTLERVVERYGIDVRLQHELVEVDGANRRARFVDRSAGGERHVELDYDVMHVAPPQSAPDWLKATPLSDGTAGGYVEVDKHTLQHVRFPNVFALGDASGSPNAKTGAAVRKQAPVVVANLLAVMQGRTPAKRYDGYSSCPIVTARDRMLLAEFDYDLEHTPSIPVLDLTKERYDMWLLKRYGLPALYWHGMLKGRA